MSATRQIPLVRTPHWLLWLTLPVIFVAPGQLAHALDPKHGPFIALSDVVAVIAVGLFALWALATGGVRQLVWPPLAAWAWLVVAILSGLKAQALTPAVLEIVQIALYFGAVYMLFVNVLTTPTRRRLAVHVLLASTTIVVIAALAQYVTATDPAAVKSLFQSRTAYSGFLTLTLPLFFGLMLWSELQWERVWCGILAALGALTILAPPLIWVLVLVLVLMTAQWGRGHLTAAVILAIGIFLTLTLTLAPLNRQVFREMLNPYEEGPVYKVADVGGEEGAGDGTATGQPIVKKRWIEWMPALNMMAENFVLGIGTGNYQLSIGQPEYYGFLPNVKKSEADTNNLYLVIGSTMGFVGLICLLAYLGHFLQLAGNLWMHGDQPFSRGLACGLYGACWALLAANVFTSLFVRGNALVWVLVFALVSALTHDREVRTYLQTRGVAS